MSESAKNEPNNDLARLQRSPQAQASIQNAQQLLRAGRFTQAISAYRIILDQYPGVAPLWGELGTAAMSNLEFDLANQAYDRAAQLGANDPNLLVGVGTQFYHLRQMDKAFACMKRAVTVDPKSLNARLTLSSWYERTRHLDEAWECNEACLAEHPHAGRALYFRAFLLQCRGQNPEAETALRDMLKNEPSLPLDVQADAHHLLGVILDATGRYSEALAALAQSKAFRRQTINALAYEQVYERMEQTRRVLIAGITPEAMKRWRDEAAESPSPRPLAMVGGSPRSGTTLLEQILAVHPEILVFDESHAYGRELSNVLGPVPPGPPLTFRTLDGLPASARTHLIGRYFKSLLREAEDKPGAKLLLDKNPSTTESLYIWLRLFPLSKVIIALRDPRDVIISCYFQNIPVSWTNISFLSVDKTAKYYANCMDVWLRMRDVGGFEWLETRYENIVGNLAAEGRRVTDFLGVPWHDSQARFYESAQRKFVHSPTYNEVTKPVYNKAVGRWKRYAEAVEPQLAALQPYLRAFGYE